MGKLERCSNQNEMKLIMGAFSLTAVRHLGQLLLYRAVLYLILRSYRQSSPMQRLKSAPYLKTFEDEQQVLHGARLRLHLSQTNTTTRLAVGDKR